MRSIWVGVVLLAIQMPAAGAEEKKPAGNWFTRLFHKSSPAPAKQEAKNQAVAPEAQPILARSALFRRLSVCDKLRQVSLQTNDNDLERKADMIEARAWEEYNQEINRVAQSRSTLDPSEQILDRHLGVNAGDDHVSSRAGRK